MGPARVTAEPRSSPRPPARKLPAAAESALSAGPARLRSRRCIPGGSGRPGGLQEAPPEPLQGGPDPCWSGRSSGALKNGGRLSPPGQVQVWLPDKRLGRRPVHDGLGRGQRGSGEFLAAPRERETGAGGGPLGIAPSRWFYGRYGAALGFHKAPCRTSATALQACQDDLEKQRGPESLWGQQLAQPGQGPHLGRSPGTASATFQTPGISEGLGVLSLYIAQSGLAWGAGGGERGQQQQHPGGDGERGWESGPDPPGGSRVDIWKGSGLPPKQAAPSVPEGFACQRPLPLPWARAV